MRDHTKEDVNHFSCDELCDWKESLKANCGFCGRMVDADELEELVSGDFTYQSCEQCRCQHRSVRAKELDTICEQTGYREMDVRVTCVDCRAEFTAGEYSAFLDSQAELTVAKRKESASERVTPSMPEVA